MESFKFFLVREPCHSISSSASIAKILIYFFVLEGIINIKSYKSTMLYMGTAVFLDLILWMRR
jgi:hypothetical protein